MTTQLLYGLAGVALLALGLRGALVLGALVRKVVALNVMGSGVFLLLVAVAYRGEREAADPILHALVLTGIVVAVSATALALAVERRRREAPEDD